ncbi:hypothetical protein G1L01_11405 [Tenacibaculum finnmarkense]|uniref:hypothetical protein n=1 Tax=Tenacibaculum finnmarkense TaxID=2781243 RepID=UPI001EFC02B5|nr:hypothetical protein [Tenacibaculum finnmarkense]MCG8203225.1 hypothetical protein [Tenacibaculum finnmarkense genomovar finnmarkense]MCG8881067.1 hypothetical protein [Tenacibaculum finnmarkense]MCM8865980.1 hypothetical protein [Tenacibaculum finnmarkense genomovar finnmarkense]MCM8888125.1 hypothetical protein [Tenacibaculum finnmarkense genomovar finnmarkense]MCM8896621.1 hypothetical protein [Tenacibaculum finnmarkense genomovar finnmarkense]
MQLIKILFLLFPLTIFSQESKTMPARQKGNVFKSWATEPSENLNKSGLIIVEKTMYGLHFFDDKLDKKIKERIRKFFKQRYYGFSDLKKYELKIEKIGSDWFIDNNKIPK